jgi:hypothetical protein
MLVHQLPPGSSNPRVKIWRRLQDLGAIPLRNAVYVLPNSPQAREDFAWIQKEIAGLNGQASVFTADTAEGVDRGPIIEMFRTARTAEFESLRKDIERVARDVKRQSVRNDLRPARRVRALRDRLQAIEATDFFSAPGGDETRQELQRLEGNMRKSRVRASTSRPTRLKADDYQRRVWVTRPRPGVDRMSSAWLIRRFIDPAARFAFVPRYETQKDRQVPFDMYTGTFSHQDSRCTFEVLLETFGLETPALRRIAEIVHDLDLKDRRYQRAEAPTIGALVEGVRDGGEEDAEILERGIQIFEALYRSFEAGGTKALAPRRPTRKHRTGR